MSPVNPFAAFEDPAVETSTPADNPPDIELGDQTEDSQEDTPRDTAGADFHPPEDTQEDQEDQTTFTRTGRRLMDPATVQALRGDYEYSRDLAKGATTAEEWETVGDTERRLAKEYGVSATTVHEVVLGLRYPNAPGPIDVARRARYDRYLAERETLGEKAALARMRDVDTASDTSAAVVVVAVTLPDQDHADSTQYIYPPGTVVSVTTLDKATADKAAQDSSQDQSTPSQDTSRDTQTSKKGK